MNKEETIRRYGKAAWQRHLAQRRAYYKAHKEEEKACTKTWRVEHPKETKAAVHKYQGEHPEEVIANDQEAYRKGGRRYAKHLIDNRTGLQGDRNRIRINHAKQYRPYKQIIAPDSQLHHEWIPRTAEYRGVALVEADAHMHGFVDVIEILAGKITLRTEEEIKRGGKKK